MDKKLIKIIIIVGIIIMIGLASLFINHRINQTDEDIIKQITASEVKDVMQVDESVILIDTRSEDEYAEKRIPGSINIPLEFLNEIAPHIITDLNTKIIVYCESGNRSSDAANLLAELGFTNIHDLGGIDTWPYDTTSGRG